MWDMKGDMGGSAAVVGAMAGLAGRKAKANVVGIVGLVENMPDGNAVPGAILVALGTERAGVFSNDDTLAGQIASASETTREKSWRLPMGPEYDRLLDSPNADMKNIGGRLAGSITAAQFLQRFVGKGIPWAHIDVAGTAMKPSNRTEGCCRDCLRRPGKKAGGLW